MNWLRRFMGGRYGMDQLSSAMVLMALLLLIISRLSNIQAIYLVSVVFMVGAYYRFFSRKINKRIMENRKFLDLVAPVTRRSRLLVNAFKERKDFKYFKCNSCGQMVRVPKGKGRVSITCPSCKNSMIRKA